MQTPDTKMFLDMQEHPEKYSEEQIESMMDEIDRVPDVDVAWQKFAQRQQMAKRPARRWMKAAASIIGVIMISGIAIAAIHMVHQYQRKQQLAIDSLTTVNAQTSTRVPQLAEADTLVEGLRIFDNVPLDTMLIEISSHYHVVVDFRRDEARQLRLHFVWRPDEGLDRVVERLNNFEAVNIVVEPEKLIVR